VWAGYNLGIAVLQVEKCATTNAKTITEFDQYSLAKGRRGADRPG